jgi:nucleotide-binding universal stress UspA family protein
MFSKIVVPLDGSSLAEGILDRVEELARVQGGEVQLLRVAYFSSLPGLDAEEYELKVVRGAEEYLNRISADLEGRGLRVSTHVRYGDPAGEILTHAEKYGSVIVMTTHGGGGLTRWAMGSVADKVIRRSVKPVLLIRVGKPPRDRN